MRIGIDVQTLETNERHRGIGKLCARTIRLLSAFAPEHEVILFGLGATPGPEIEPLLGGNTSYARIITDGDPTDHLRLGCAAPFLWSTPEGKSLDLYHVTSPLMFDILMPAWSPCPVTATLLDAIPAVLRVRDTPIFDDAGWRRYEQRVHVLSSYQGFLPISTSAAEDCAVHLDLPIRRMQVTYVPIAQRPVAGLSDERAREIINRFEIKPGYVISVSGYNPRKNLKGMLRSYALLSPELRQSHPLVLVCSLEDSEREEVYRQARQHGVEQDLKTTGYVTDEELLALVRCAGCMIFTSRYEGFGIPPAEAMATGTPVVVSNTSSLPEVAGDAGILVDPDDEHGFADAVRLLLTDSTERRDRVARGYLHVERFAPEEYLDRLLRGYEEARSGNATTCPARTPSGKSGRLRVAVFSPLAPRMSGIAEYNEQLIQHLGDEIEAECFIEEYSPSTPAIREHFSCFSYSAFERRRTEQPYDAVLYQIGNNTLHAYTLPFAERYPGICVLHDYGLLGLNRVLARQYGERHEAQRRFAGQYPDADPGVWEDDALLNKLDAHDYAMTRSLLNTSRAVVVHSQWLADEVKAGGGGDANVQVIPLGVDFSYVDAPRVPHHELRRKYHLPPDAFVVVSVGVINRLKRLVEVLEAFEAYHRSEPNSYFLLLGPADPGTLKRMNDFCAQHRLKHCVRFLGQRPNEDLYDVIALSDVCVTLRYPSMGESSAALMNVMAMGKPALVTPVNQFLEYPDSVCWKVRPGVDERHDLLGYFRHLRAHPEVGETLGRNAQQFVRANAWDKVAKLYLDLLHSVAEEEKSRAGVQPGVPQVARASRPLNPESAV